MNTWIAHRPDNFIFVIIEGYMFTANIEFGEFEKPRTIYEPIKILWNLMIHNPIHGQRIIGVDIESQLMFPIWKTLRLELRACFRYVVQIKK